MMNIVFYGIEFRYVFAIYISKYNYKACQQIMK